MSDFKRLITSPTARLATTYVAIIMVMSIGFSIVFYNASVNTLRRQVPPNTSVQGTNPFGGQPLDGRVRQFLDQRAEEGRDALLQRLIAVNILALVAGTGISYYLARRNLRPIERAMEAQGQFVSDASHELRTPLTAMRTTNEVALRAPKLTAHDARKLIQGNVEEIIKLQELSDGLLNLAKPDTSPVVLTAVSIQQTVQEAINTLIPVAQAKNITVDDQAAPLLVRFEPAALRQILVILLDNAIKYSPENSTITVLTKQQAGKVAVQVNDDGQGIRASDLPHIFSRFYRADSARSSGMQHGYGLGLAIAQSLAGRYGTEITANSEIGKGSTFSIQCKVDTVSGMNK